MNDSFVVKEHRQFAPNDSMLVFPQSFKPWHVLTSITAFASGSHWHDSAEDDDNEDKPNRS
jgi:hypothetical protein